MICIPNNASTEDVLQVVQAWVDLWAELGPEAAFTAIAADGQNTWTPEWLEQAVANYRPSEMYPDTQEFAVTPCESAKAINHDPTRKVEWYKPNKSRLAGYVNFDLPLNGQWSDLLAEFEVWEGGDPQGDYILALSEIRSWDQFWSEEEQELAKEAKVNC
jgi:hypothetical protein